jgi:hypothetical protein
MSDTFLAQVTAMKNSTMLSPQCRMPKNLEHSASGQLWTVKIWTGVFKSPLYLFQIPAVPGFLCFTIFMFSGLTGKNLVNNSSQISWYKEGPTLLEAIDTFQPPQRLVEKPFRLSISDVYKVCFYLFFLLFCRTSG